MQPKMCTLLSSGANRSATHAKKNCPTQSRRRQSGRRASPSGKNHQIPATKSKDLGVWQMSVENAIQVVLSEHDASENVSTRTSHSSPKGETGFHVSLTGSTPPVDSTAHCNGPILVCHRQPLLRFAAFPSSPLHQVTCPSLALELFRVQARALIRVSIDGLRAVNGLYCSLQCSSSHVSLSSTRQPCNSHSSPDTDIRAEFLQKNSPFAFTVTAREKTLRKTSFCRNKRQELVSIVEQRVRQEERGALCVRQDCVLFAIFIPSSLQLFSVCGFRHPAHFAW